MSARPGGCGGGFLAWRRCRRGAVSIEIAIVVPALVMAAVGLIDLVRFMHTTARIDRAVTSIADMITRSPLLYDRTDFNDPQDSQELGMFFLASNLTALPDDLAGRGRVIVTSVTTEATGYTTNWQRTGPYGLEAESRLDALPSLPGSNTYIVAEAFYRYRPIILDVFGVLPDAQATIYRRAIYRPRLATLRDLTPG